MMVVFDEESSDLETFIVLRRRVLLQCAGRAARQLWGRCHSTLPGPAAERAAASDGRKRRQPAAHLAGSAQAS
eukprot:671884-Prymnesium_polylepis.1